uniref:Uncharacterized protein n=1 Tax=Brassica campestris TaxID=3711 RepID=M4FHF0_BRACM
MNGETTSKRGIYFAKWSLFLLTVAVVLSKQGDNKDEAPLAPAVGFLAVAGSSSSPPLGCFFAPVFHLLVGADMLGVLVDVSWRNPNSAPGRAISGGLRPLPGISARRQRLWSTASRRFRFYWRLSLWRGPVTSPELALGVLLRRRGFVHRSMEATALLREAPSSMAVSFSSTAASFHLPDSSHFCDCVLGPLVPISPLRFISFSSTLHRFEALKRNKGRLRFSYSGQGAICNSDLVCRVQVARRPGYGVHLCSQLSSQPVFVRMVWVGGLRIIVQVHPASWDFRGLATPMMARVFRQPRKRGERHPLVVPIIGREQ